MTFDPPASGYTNYTTAMSDNAASVHRHPRRRRDVKLLAETTAHYGPNSARSIGRGFVAEHDVQQNPQQIDSPQQIHN